jgi:hypothetical protein
VQAAQPLTISLLLALAVGCRPARPRIVPEIHPGKAVFMREGNRPDFVQLSRSGKFVLLASGPDGHTDNGVVRVFDAQTLRLLWDDWGYDARMDPSEKQVAMSPEDLSRVQIRDLSTGAVRQTILGDPRPFVFAGPSILAVTRQKTLTGLEVASGQTKWTLPVPDEVFILRSSDDGRVLALQVRARRESDPKRWAEAWVVRPGDARPHCTFGANEGLALSPDGRTIAVSDHYDTTTLYDTESCQVLARSSCGPGTLSDDHTWATIATERNAEHPRLVLWRIPEREQLATLPLPAVPHAFQVAGGLVAFTTVSDESPYGTQLTLEAAPSLLGPSSDRSPIRCALSL